MSKYANVVCLYIDSLVYTVRNARILGWPVVYMLKHIHKHAYTNEQKYNVWNWNELRTETTSFDCSFHCDIPLNLKIIIRRYVKLLALTCSAFGLWFYIVQKSMVLHINIS